MLQSSMAPWLMGGIISAPNSCTPLHTQPHHHYHHSHQRHHPVHLALDISTSKVQMSAHKTQIELQQCDISVCRLRVIKKVGKTVRRLEGISFTAVVEEVGHSGCVVSEFSSLCDRLALFSKALIVEENKKQTTLLRFPSFTGSCCSYELSSKQLRFWICIQPF